jgi:MFS family permease
MKLTLFLMSCLLAFLAGHMVNYSIIFLSLEWFDSHALAGLGYGLCFGPPIILGWFAGVYCDRYSPRRVILIAQNSYFTSLGLLFLALSATPDIQQILIISAAFCSGVGWSFVAPARFATLPHYVSSGKITGATIGLNLMVMMGFGLAPMILKWIKVAGDWQAVIATAASLALISSLLLLPLKFEFKGKPANKAIDEIKASLDYVKQSIFIRQFLLLATITYLLMGPMQVLLPTVAEKNLRLAETAQGNYLSLVAFSLIVGGLLAMVLKGKGKLGWQILLSILISGVGIGYLGLETDLASSVAVLVLSAAFGGIAISLIVAGLQHYSPAEHRGRIMSFYTIIGQFIPAASGVGAGIFASVFDYTQALLIFGGIIVVAIITCMLLLASVRKLEKFEHVE